jgi:hypothetical protein
MPVFVHITLDRKEGYSQVNEYVLFVFTFLAFFL